MYYSLNFGIILFEKVNNHFKENFLEILVIF